MASSSDFAKMNSEQLRLAWIASEDPQEMEEIRSHMFDACVEENLVCHADVGFSGETVGGGKNPELKKLNEQISHLQHLVDIGGYKTKAKRPLTIDEMKDGMVEGRAPTAKEADEKMLLVSRPFTKGEMTLKLQELEQLKEAREEEVCIHISVFDSYA